jgi:hypothetical protein
MKRYVGTFHAKEWVELVVSRAEKYAASAVVMSADFTSRPGALGTPRAYLLVGANEFHQSLPEGFDLDEVLSLLLKAAGVRSPQVDTGSQDISFCARVGRRDFQAGLRSTTNGVELVIHISAAR